MLPSELGFSFGDKHCMSDFGLIFVPSDIDLGGPVTRDEYEIAGVDGTLLFPKAKREAYRISGTLYAWNRDAAWYASQERVSADLRSAVTWLRSGRQKLCFDWESDVYYIAQVDDQLTWSYKSFIEGGLSLSFSVQPLRYMKVADTAEKTVSSSPASVTLNLRGSLSAPLCAVITNLGLKMLKNISVTRGGKSVSLSGVNLQTAEKLIISGEAPVGARVEYSGVSVDALPYVTAFDEVTAEPGANTVNVTVSFGDDSTNGESYTDAKKLKIELSARGRVE